MPKAIPSTGRQMQARLATDNPSDRRIREKLIRPKPYHERDLGMLVQGNNELNSYMRRTEDMNLDTVSEGIFSKLLKKKKKGLSHDYSAKVRRQQYKAFVNRYATAYDPKTQKYKDEKVTEDYKHAWKNLRQDKYGNLHVSELERTPKGEGEGAEKRYRQSGGDKKDRVTPSREGKKAPGDDVRIKIKPDRVLRHENPVPVEVKPMTALERIEARKKLKEAIVEAIIHEITISNANVGSSNRSDYGGGSGKLSGGFGTQGSSTSRFGGGSGGTSAVMGGVRSGTSGAGKAGGGFGTRGSSPGRFGAKTSGGRMGGGDTRNVGRASPGSTSPGQRNSPARPNPVASSPASRPNSPGMTGRGGAGGRSVYGGNRQYSGQSNSRYGNRGTRPSVGSANPSNNRSEWWKR